MKNLFGCLGALLILPLLLIVAILFNGWYLQVIYDIGLVPILGQFGLFLPQLGYWVFVLIGVSRMDKPNITNIILVVALITIIIILIS